jgi:hypothetical protein
VSDDQTAARFEGSWFYFEKSEVVVYAGSGSISEVKWRAVDSFTIIGAAKPQFLGEMRAWRRMKISW